MDQEALQRAFIDMLHRFGKMGQPIHLFHLTKAEFFVLELLARHRTKHPDTKGMYVSQLVGHLHASGPAVSRVLKTLEGKGYIERHVDKVDRRNTYIAVTQEGDAVWERAEVSLQQFMCLVTDRMGFQEMGTLISLWNRLLDAVEDVRRNEEK